MAVTNLIAKRLNEMAKSIELKDDIYLHIELTFLSDTEGPAYNRLRVEYFVYSYTSRVDRCKTARFYPLDLNLTTLLSNIEDDIKSDIKEHLKSKRITLGELIEKLKDFLGDDVWYDISDDRICDFCGEWISFYPLKGKLYFTEDDYDEISDYLLNDKGERFLIDRHFNQFMDYMERFRGARVLYWKGDKVGLDLRLENNGRSVMSTFDLTAFGYVRNFLDWYEKRYPLKGNEEIELIDLDEDDFQFEDDFS